MHLLKIAGIAACAALMAAGAARADIVIGYAGPLSGQLAALGTQVRAGADQAVADINAAGGLLGQTVVLEIGDDQCDPKQAVAVANGFAGRNVRFVAGHICSGSSIPASAIYAEEGIVMISPSATSPKLTDERAGPGIYRVCGRDDQQGQIAGRALAGRFRSQAIAIVHDKAAYGMGLATETKRTMNAAGKQEKMFEGIAAGEKDYSALVSRLKAEAIDVLYFGGYHAEAGLIIRQMRDQGLKTLLVGGDGLVNDEFWAITGEAGAGTLMTFSPDPKRNPDAAAALARIRARGTGEPHGYALYAYAAVQAWAEAVKRAGSADREPVAKALDTGEFSTIIGSLRFDGKGDVSLPGYVFYEWRGGKYDYATP